MPDPDIPQVSLATLRQAVLWVAKKLPPLELRFEKLKKYPSYVKRPQGFMIEFASQDEKAIEYAKDNIAQALMLGYIQAHGRRGIETSGTKIVKRDPGSIDEYEHFACCKHYDENSDIPSDFWETEYIWWDHSVIRKEIRVGPDDATPVVSEYIDIRIATADLYRVFPDERENRPTDNAPARAKRGRRPKYDPLEFFILCALEADSGGLLTKEADFVRRMSELLSVVWGEDESPGPTWLKERFAEIKKYREVYDRGRRQLDGREITD